jgi:hypothetical protein
MMSAFVFWNYFISKQNPSQFYENCLGWSHIFETYILAFLSLWQAPERNKLKEEIFILSHGVRGFSPWSYGSIGSKTVTTQKHHGGRAQQKKKLLPWRQPGLKESDRKGPGARAIFLGHIPWDPPPPTRCHLPHLYHFSIVCSNFGSIDGWIPGWRQSSHEHLPKAPPLNIACIRDQTFKIWTNNPNH